MLSKKLDIIPNIKNILMVKPTFFDVTYSINPWMDINQHVDKTKAMNQWEYLKKTIENAGAKVHVMDPVGAEFFPDIVFAANAGVVRHNKVYLANFHFPERKGEKYFFDKLFKNNGFETHCNYDIPFEGAGDALWAGKNQSKLFCGIGPRTDIKALFEIKNFLENDASFTIYGCRMTDPRFYHLDTCFCPLNDEIALWYPYAFDHVAQYNMKNEIELIPVSEKDACKFACNAVVVGKNVILNQDTDDTAKMLEKLGFNPLFVDMSEFIKSGGSAKCCTLTLNE